MGKNRACEWNKIDVNKLGLTTEIRKCMTCQCRKKGQMKEPKRKKREKLIN